MKTYRGARTRQGPLVGVTDGYRAYVLRHACGGNQPCVSPSGFEWGYAGSGPAELALALLADALPGERGQPTFPLAALHFKEQVVSDFEYDGWVLSETEIRAWFEVFRFHAPAP